VLGVARVSNYNGKKVKKKRKKEEKKKNYEMSR
jgi:hypothetical protein